MLPRKLPTKNSTTRLIGTITMPGPTVSMPSWVVFPLMKEVK
jgi:hypothetical protein